MGGLIRPTTNIFRLSASSAKRSGVPAAERLPANCVIRKKIQNENPHAKNSNQTMISETSQEIDVSELVNNITLAAELLANMTVSEQRLEDERITHKLAAIERIMARGDNTLTGKPHSYSSAEAVVNTDAEYQTYLAMIRSAVRDRILAKGNYDAAIAAARLREQTNA